MWVGLDPTAFSAIPGDVPTCPHPGAEGSRFVGHCPYRAAFEWAETTITVPVPLHDPLRRGTGDTREFGDTLV